MRLPLRTDDLGIEAWRSVLLAYNAALRAIEAELDRAGSIPLTWYDVLLELQAAEAPGLRMRDLADRVVLSRTRVSRLVDEMAAAGLVRKETDAQDRRVVWAVLTEDGRTAFRTTVPIYLGGIEKHFAAHLTDEEKQVTAAALLKVAHAHRSSTVDPPPGP
ncbi:DNA-binding MarR family transcriptional regulator [Actinokineospora baliensis]|uniref:MarR family winged helix-turn-helix transcriptional regulator n=1 Tax=Actinokineospora baliensis TaxID=547056 RepID=UPI0019580EFE|nr:MarR family winged helix-turn-helix transcriptional regulator [Actinokineospora baliensis]MBM7776100.1 DNA-binding MarR family transcriptional regulator [Actinokineospora baliensis]